MFIAYREKVEAIVTEGNDLRHIDRLAKMDVVNKTGTTEDKKRA